MSRLGMGVGEVGEGGGDYSQRKTEKKQSDNNNTIYDDYSGGSSRTEQKPRMSITVIKVFHNILYSIFSCFILLHYTIIYKNIKIT